MMRLSQNLLRFRWLVFISWLLVALSALHLASSQSDHLTGGGFEVAGSSSLRVQRQLESQFPRQGASPLGLVAAPDINATIQDMQHAVEFLQRVANETPHVRAIPHLRQSSPRPDQPYVIFLQLDFNNTGAVDVAKKLRRDLGVHGDQPGHSANGSVHFYVIGQGALGAAASAKTKKDIAAAERWNLPVVLVVLLAVFGSLTAAVIPLILGIITVTTSMGLVYLLSIYTPISVFVTPTVSMFGIALAVDYSLFILMRYREELSAGQQPRPSIDTAMATSGLAVVLSGLTVIASLTGIYLINTPVLRSMATGAIVAVSVAVLAATTLTPLFLVIFGKRVAKHASLLRWLQPASNNQSRFWVRWTSTVMRRPWVTAIAATIVLLVIAAPSVSLRLGNSMLHQFDSSHEMRSGTAAAAQALGPGALGPIRVLVNFPENNASQQVPLLTTISNQMSQAPYVASVSPPVFGQDNRSVLLSATLGIDPEDMEARKTIDWLRQQLPHSVNPDQVHIDVGGPTALIKDFDDQVTKTEPIVLLFVTGIAFVMLLISIHSVFLAFKGVLMTVLSVATSYGALVMVFQWGWLQHLGVKPTGSIDSFIPPIVLAMTFGLSMDYEIFLLTRIRERFLQCHHTVEAVTYAVTTSARTITSAALIMCAVFIGFAFAGMPLVAELGIACAVAIAVDATIVRLVLVPALMATFSQWNWWLPRWLAVILPSVDFHNPRVARVDRKEDSADRCLILPSDLSIADTDKELLIADLKRFHDLLSESIDLPDPLLTHIYTQLYEHRQSAQQLNDISQQLHLLSYKDGLPSNNLVQISHPFVLIESFTGLGIQALQGFTRTDKAMIYRRCKPMETTFIQFSSGDQFSIPTVQEAFRLVSYQLLTENRVNDYCIFTALSSLVEPSVVASILVELDHYYEYQPSHRYPLATQLVTYLSHPQPSDFDIMTLSTERWEHIKDCCLILAIAMVEKTT